MLEIGKEIKSMEILKEVSRLIEKHGYDYSVEDIGATYFHSWKEGQFKLKVTFPNKTTLELSIRQHVSEGV